MFTQRLQQTTNVNKMEQKKNFQHYLNRTIYKI